MIKLQKWLKIFFWTFAITIVGFILIGNFAPFGIKHSYSGIDNKNINAPTPKERVTIIEENEKIYYKQISDNIYFSTNMPFKFDTAKIKISFKNFNNQQLFLGNQNQEEGYNDSKLVDAPFIDLPAWPKVGDNPKLYQKEPKYTSVEAFINNPPIGQIIGAFNYDTNTFGLSKMNLPNYQPKNSETVINTPLRGRHILYAYLKNERFKMTIFKQDLNSYEDPDPVTVTIFKDNDIVYKLTADDDGIADTSGKVLPPQEIFIEDPDEELPEEGVYKIVIDTSPDVVIKQIKTNLHKIVFEGPIYPIDNSEVFSKITKNTYPTKLFTNAKSITARTFHNPALQEIKIASDGADILATPKPTPRPRRGQEVASDSAIQTIKLDTLNEDVTATMSASISQIYFPKSDVVVNGYLGYFAFEKDQLFYPTAYSVLPITKKEDLEKVDFILTDYNSPTMDGEWKVAEVEFDLSNAVIKNGKLSWLIRAPGLKENNREVIIKNIEVEFKKNPLIKIPGIN